MFYSGYMIFYCNNFTYLKYIAYNLVWYNKMFDNNKH